MAEFEVDVKEGRRRILWNGRFITAINQGATRNYLYPVFTPSGQAVTDETPVDHPHHRSIWVAAELVNGYNFYVESTYGGRVPGAITEVAVSWEQVASSHLQVRQTLEWRGKPDFSDPVGRLLLVETRTTDVQPGAMANVLTVRSQLLPGGSRGATAVGPDRDGAQPVKDPDLVTIGPTKHSFFGVRLSDRLHVSQGGAIKDSEGRTNEAEIFDQTADWVDAHGALAFGKTAGIGVLPDASFDGAPWMVRDYGSLMVSTMRLQPVTVAVDAPLDQSVRFVVHDGDHLEADIAGEFERFRSRETMER